MTNKKPKKLHTQTHVPARARHGRIPYVHYITPPPTPRSISHLGRGLIRCLITVNEKELRAELYTITVTCRIQEKTQTKINKYKSSWM